MKFSLMIQTLLMLGASISMSISLVNAAPQGEYTAETSFFNPFSHHHHAKGCVTKLGCRFTAIYSLLVLNLQTLRYAHQRGKKGIRRAQIRGAAHCSPGHC